MDKEIEYKTTDKYTEKVIADILKVKKEKGLDAESILEEAKNKYSSLHNFFEWDNTKAGEQYRLYQARLIINEVKIIVEGRELYAFEICNVKIEDSNEHKKVYMEKSEIMKSPELKEQVIRSALQQVEYWSEKYKTYSELSPIIKSIKKVRKELDKKWAKKKQ